MGLLYSIMFIRLRVAELKTTSGLGAVSFIEIFIGILSYSSKKNLRSLACDKK